ncbi:hypothetical protein [Dysgonomonas sp. Marseille-P4361]|uniref:hypothetical protein n=1 Tax=Dysgonomonas sp. Marseille-P4361 TaxID=2161820 RepID=UPI00135C4D69|nr:hypothetical protein [Dysgonomonas sp. Marseille-P4361]
MHRQELKHRIVTGLLVFVFLAPFVSKPVHIYQNECEEHSCSHAEDKATHKHDCNTCKICQFQLSFFTEAKSSLLIIKPVELCSKVYTRYEEKEYTPSLSLHQARAPPHTALI